MPSITLSSDQFQQFEDAFEAARKAHAEHDDA
jgi:hypothetical protein